MAVRLHPLVVFDGGYYRYPVSVSRGFWSRLSVDLGLEPPEREQRARWMSEIHRRSGTAFGKEVRARFFDLADPQRLLGMIPRFGVFVERFFFRTIRPRLVQTFASSRSNCSDIQRLAAEASGCHVYCRTSGEAISLIGDSVFEQALLTLTPAELTAACAAWFHSNSIGKPCGLCGNLYRVIDLPDWVYFGSGGCDACCMRCPVLARPVKKLLPALISEFVAACGFIPPANAEPLNFSFTSRLHSSAHWLSVFAALARMGGIKHASTKLGGSWFKALAQSGVLPDGVLATTRGIRCLARDGHECNSLDEQRIDDWLTEMGISHEKEPLYPPHPVLNPHGKRRADWRVGNSFIEYLGLAGDGAYDRKSEEKMDLAVALGLTLIAIYPEHLGVLDDRLSSLLSPQTPTAR